ncbi:MAG TPA: hypothetical protein VGZ33_04115 [Acidimicrobiales bacterium]|nr:hypothetical protein [Acidimicrobiales bacterium]
MRPPLRRVRAGCAALAASAVLVGSGAVALAASATGDDATIRLFRDVAANTNAQPAMQIAQSGYMTESAHVRSPATFSYRWGFAGVPKGSVRATETITYAQLDGRVAWVTDVLDGSVPGCQRTSGCPTLTPIELLVTRVAAFAGLVDRPGGAVGCFVREPLTNVPYRAGGRWWTAIGDFRPMALRGNQVLVTVTYAWSDGRHVVERDSIDRSTNLFTASGFHVGSGAGAGQAPFSFAQTDTALSHAPPAPRVTLCP